MYRIIHIIDAFDERLEWLPLMKLAADQLALRHEVDVVSLGPDAPRASIWPRGVALHYGREGLDFVERVTSFPPPGPQPVIHTHGNRALVRVAPLLWTHPPLPRVHTVLPTDELLTTDSALDAATLLMHRVQAAAAGTVTAALRLAARTRIGFSVVYPGIDGAMLEAGTEDMPPLPGGNFTIGAYVASDDTDGMRVVLAVLRGVLEAGRDAHLVLFDTRAPIWPYPRLTVPNIANRLHTAIDLPHARALLQRTAVFVTPAVSEFLPGALVTALAAGVPVVGTSSPAFDEAVRHEQNGLIAASATETDVTAAVVRLAQDMSLRRKLSASAKERAGKDFSPALQLDRYLTLYGRAVTACQADARGW